ncbi:hypothetical protein VTK56DRAFT_7235 [Thermocarpiscus australiensis]
MDSDLDHASLPFSKPHAHGGLNSSEEHDRVVCAISESRASDVIGMAVINVTMGQVEITRILNDDRYQRLIETIWRMPNRPQTFLVLKKVVDEQSKSLLVCCLNKEFPGAEVVPLEREHWNESEGLRMIDRFAWRKDIKAIRANLEHNFYASCAFSAAMAYVEGELEVVFRENSLHIKYNHPADTMGLDRSTVSALELLQNIRQAKGASSTLFGLLNNTLTPQGRRLIRSALLQPSTDKSVIAARHEAVEDLSRNEDLFMELRESLKRLLHTDIERSIPWHKIALKAGDSRLPLQDGVVLTGGHHQIVMPSHEELHGAEKDLNQVLMIKAYLGGIQALRETLEAANCTSQLCRWALEKCGHENTAPICDLIGETIEQDATYSKAPIDIRNNRLWAVKAEPNGVLERARQLYRERINEMHEYVEGLNKIFQGNDMVVGVQHWRQRVVGGVEIVNATRRKQHYCCQTMELIQKSSQIQRQADIVTAQSDKFVIELKRSLVDHADSLLALSEATAVLDMLCSFTHLAMVQNYVRPIISDNLVLKAARHPVVEARKANFVPNDVYSGNQDARFQVITGGNMSGKSTFIRSIALIQIMAQIGSFVPAQYAAIPICDRLFTRLSTEDKPESNLGTFAVEMTEMNMILRQVTKDSLVIIDELGRGTSTKEGLAIALAMSEKLIEKGCRVFFATHFTELARVLNSTKPSSVLNVHIVGKSMKACDTPRINLPHTIASGPVKNEDYGLDLARRFLPERVIKNAEQVCKFLIHRNASKRIGPATRAAKQKKLILALPDLLKQAYDSTMDGSALASYLKKLQTEFTIRMNMAADEDAGGGEDDDNVDHTIERPALQKPSEEELEEWKKKCDAAERRVMHANMAGSQELKRPAGDKSDRELRKRSKMDCEAESVSQPTPINRGAMIEQLRRETSTPSNRDETPSSSTMDIPEAYMDYTTEMPEPEGMTGKAIEQSNEQRAISISSDSSSDENEMEGIDDGYDLPSTADKNSRAPSPESNQPLLRFQPLKEWYARGGQAGASSAEPSLTSSRRSRSATREFLGRLSGDETD